MESLINNAKEIHDFIFAGNAYFTLKSKVTGARYTYRVSRAKNDNSLYGEMFFVSLLAGPENTSDYQYMGVVDSRGFRLTKASKFSPTSIPVTAFKWAFENIRFGKIPEKLEFWHAGRCGRCGRMLTVPESVESGYGPECISDGSVIKK